MATMKKLIQEKRNSIDLDLDTCLFLTVKKCQFMNKRKAK